MYEVQKEAETLETLRKRAQISYGIYAAGLLVAVVMAFVSNIMWAAVIAALILFVYILVGKSTVKAYKERYKQVKLDNEMLGILENPEYVKKGLFAAKQIEEDAILDVRPGSGIVNIGVKGRTSRNIETELADVAFQVSIVPLSGKETVRVLTGCYMRFSKPSAPGLDSCVFHETNRYAEALKAHYESLDYQRTRWDSLMVYTSKDAQPPTDEVMKKAAQLDGVSNHDEILRFYPDRAVVFMQGRFLNYGEPDYKHEIKIEGLRERYFPELKNVIALIHAL